MQTKSISFRLSEEDHQEMSRLAELNNMSVSHFVRHLVSLEIERAFYEKRHQTKQGEKDMAAALGTLLIFSEQNGPESHAVVLDRGEKALEGILQYLRKPK